MTKNQQLSQLNKDISKKFKGPITNYVLTIQGLKKYSKFKKIPSDPYDVSASSAKELLEYQKNIILTNEEQAIYDHAVEDSHEGGPCCCKCWHWYAYEGLAKYLITEKGFTAEQIADVWDLSDACGGAGHGNGAYFARWYSPTTTIRQN